MALDNLVAIDDETLEDVAGGLGLSIDLGPLAGLRVGLTEHGLKGSVTLLGHTLSLGVGFDFDGCAGGRAYSRR